MSLRLRRNLERSARFGIALTMVLALHVWAADLSLAPPAPEPALMEHAQAGIPVEAVPSQRVSIEARVLLQREIEHVATTAP